MICHQAVAGFISIVYLRAHCLREDVRALDSSWPPVSFVKRELIIILDYSAHSTGDARDNSSTWTNLFTITLFSKKCD